MFLHVVEARYLGDYQVEIVFNDGRRGVANLAEALVGPVFEPLRDPEAFAQLRVDQELETIVWPNGADLAPEYLYFLAFRVEPALQERFRAWGYASSDARRDPARTEHGPGW